MLRFSGHALLFVILTALTQLGGIAWLIAGVFKKRLRMFLLVYILMALFAHWFAPLFGRVPLSCRNTISPHMQSWMYCALNRNYVTPQTATVLHDFAAAMAERNPGTITLVLDANFPFLNGFPLLPHLSHNDGRKVDIALYYRDQNGYLPGKTRSPIGYFAFEAGPSDCPDVWPTLRWNLSALQNLWPKYELDKQRMGDALRILSSEKHVEKIFIEPHLKAKFGVQSPKLRFQGCRAARHDDHIHIQLRPDT